MSSSDESNIDTDADNQQSVKGGEDGDPTEGKKSYNHTPAGADPEELTALVEELRSENERLREEYVSSQRNEYRRTAIALVILGTMGVAGGFVFTVARQVLFVLGGVGLFGGVLTWYLTPERLVSISIGESVYESTAETGQRLQAELDLQETAVYVPITGLTGKSVRLFIPQSSDYQIPDIEALESLFVLPESSDERGVSLRPTAAGLVQEFERSVSGEIAKEPRPLATQLGDALVKQFELVDDIDTRVDTETQQIIVEVSNSIYDDLDRFDHPVASFLGAGFATGLGRPVSVDTEHDEDYTLVTCGWQEAPTNQR
ncbi:hypothetical protein SAMN05216388_104510 [Halorientalis persicus]|uniref:DUF7982 domain-containing protein n=1 Tax=Halorientalis persicus TaxID=1367881 RepID=A0A1H8W030_9EURY|nr:hypothetical protein [Halorientalis persicus]SEP20986.1 hypothetical protein SAMN05216388_104510 [Halorientalis persicus]